MSGPIHPGERRMVVMSAIRDAAGDGVEAGSPEYADLIQNVEFQVQRVLAGDGIPDWTRRMVVMSAIRDHSEGVDGPGTPGYRDLMGNVEGQVQRVLADAGLYHE